MKEKKLLIEVKIARRGGGGEKTQCKEENKMKERKRVRGGKKGMVKKERKQSDRV